MWRSSVAFAVVVGLRIIAFLFAAVRVILQASCCFGLRRRIQSMGFIVLDASVAAAAVVVVVVVVVAAAAVVGRKDKDQ